MNRRRNSSLAHRSKNAPSAVSSEGDADPRPLGYNECQEAVEKLTEFLSHELAEGEQVELQEHLQDCHGCFSKFHFEETVLSTIRERMDQLSTPAPLRERILGLLDAEMAVH